MKRVSLHLIIWTLVFSLGGWGVAIGSLMPNLPEYGHITDIIPKRLGSVDEVYTGKPDKPTIYYIQDAHSRFSAQKSIQELIAAIQERAGCGWLNANFK